MKKILNKPILLAAISFIFVWVITGGLAYGATIITKSMNATVNVVADASFAFYSDQSTTQLINEISLPDVSPGGTSIFTFYVKNTGPIAETLFTGSDSLVPSIGLLNLKFDGQSEKTLVPNAVCKVIGTLIVSETTPPGPLNFTFSVNAVRETDSSPALNGQELFNAYCLVCHSSALPGNGLSEEQLATYIGSHNTGSSLTSEQLASIASYLKQ